PSARSAGDARGFARAEDEGSNPSGRAIWKLASHPNLASNIAPVAQQGTCAPKTLRKRCPGKTGADSQARAREWLRMHRAGSQDGSVGKRVSNRSAAWSNAQVVRHCGFESRQAYQCEVALNSSSA